MSGGTAASAQATLAAAARDPALIRLLTDPFALTPGFTGPSQPSGLIPGYDPSMNVWLVPFPMAPFNTKNVHRTNFLLGHPYGTDFVYDEMMVAPGFGEIARVTTETFATMVSLFGTGGLKPGAGRHCVQPDRSTRLDERFRKRQGTGLQNREKVPGQFGFADTCRCRAYADSCNKFVVGADHWHG